MSKTQFVPNPAQEEQWKSKLSPERYRVLREGGTEPAGSSALNYNKDTGVYLCGACNNPLFSSDHKYDSGTGWPSFTDPISDTAVEYLEDNGFFMKRVEVRCARCHSHLGHVFPDGPNEGGQSGQRYCINGLALDFENNKSNPELEKQPTKSQQP